MSHRITSDKAMVNKQHGPRLAVVNALPNREHIALEFASYYNLLADRLAGNVDMNYEWLGATTAADFHALISDYFRMDTTAFCDEDDHYYCEMLFAELIVRLMAHGADAQHDISGAITRLLRISDNEI